MSRTRKERENSGSHCIGQERLKKRRSVRVVWEEKKGAKWKVGTADVVLSKIVKP